MIKDCIVKNFLTGDVFEGQIDTEKIGIEDYPFIEATEEEVIKRDIRKIQEWSNNEAKKFLADTDWKVIRHRDQLALGIPTSIDNDEFIELLNQRQEAREKVDEAGVKLILEGKNVTS